jgi:hypothetical protein
VVAVRLDQLNFQDLEELRDQITEYYETYYAELRGRLSDHGLGLSATVPDHLKGYRRVVTELGGDGAVVSHWRAGQDHFDFHISPGKKTRDLVAELCAGERILDYEPGSDFGFYQISEPLQLIVDDRVVWVADWTRLDISGRLDIWRDPEAARKAVEEDLLPYTNP